MVDAIKAAAKELPLLYDQSISMLSPTHYSHSRKKRKFFSRKKIQHGGQIVPVNSLETHVYVNITVTSPNTITVQNITSPLVQTIATNTPGSVILSVNPSLSTLKDYTLFGYNGTTWVEIPRTNLDMGGNTVALYGNVPGMLLRKQSGSQDKMASVEVSIPVPVSTYGNVMQFVNIATSIFPFPLAPSTETFSANVYIQLIFVDRYPTANTKLSGFLPKYIPGLNLWLNASEPGNNTFTPNTGVKMLNWTDKSGQNNHAAAQTATAPIYRNLPGGVGMGMYFNGSTFFSGNLRITGKHSYTFVVARPDQTNNSVGRLLSLGAPAVDDSSSNASMGVSASSGAIPPTQKRIVMGLGHLTTGWTIKYNASPTTTAAGGVITWADATSSWTNGACCSIAYGMGRFVAVGYSGQNGVIKWSQNGIDWNNANMVSGSTTTSASTNYGFYFHDADRATVSGGGGIRVVIFTGSIWICGGVNDTSLVSGTFSTYRPGLAYSYDGINWIKNTTTLPFTGTGNCITSIASDGNLIILTGVLTPSMSYSYNGINWFSMPSGVSTATQIGTTANTGIHCVAYHRELKLWMACGDGGNNVQGNPTDPEGWRKITWSIDGFNWNITWDAAESTIQILNFRFSGNTIGAYLRRIFPFFINNNPHFIISGPYMQRNGGSASGGPVMSTYNAASTFGFLLNAVNISSFPTYGTSPAEVSAAYYDGLNIYFGLQTASGSSFLIYGLPPSTNPNNPFNISAWPTVTGITAPVNAIVDNMSGDTNFKGSIHLNNTTVRDIQPDADATKPYIITSWGDGMNTCVAINGTIIPQNKANPARFNISSYMIGKNVGNTLHNYTGYIYEILAYNSLLYSSSRFAIEGYLAWKWGIQQFLPSSHAYSKNRPSAYSLTVPWPKAFSDLQPVLWLDAQDPNANESFAPEERTFIKTWYDKSGNQNDLTAPIFSEPMYTKNIIKGGGIQFNRYAYKSMSYIPLPRGKDVFATAGTCTTAPASQPASVTNTPYNWIPGLAGLSEAVGVWNITYDSFGFIYASIGVASARLLQYDEKNNQTRVLYHNPNYTHYSYSVYVSPRNGYIYLCPSFWTNAAFRVLHILIPNSFPTTATTNYPTVRIPTLNYYNMNTNTTTTLHGSIGANLFVDKNENLYMTFFGGDTGSLIYVFPYSTNLGVPDATSFTSTLCLRQLKEIRRMPDLVYSPIDNSFSYNRDSNFSGRIKFYLDTLATFVGSISGTTLTVTSVTSGRIQIGTCIDITTNTTMSYPGVVINTQTSGTTGGVGTYTLSVSPGTTVAGTHMSCIRIDLQISSVVQENSSTNTLDGLTNLGETTDVLVRTNQLLNPWAQQILTYDSITNTIYFRTDNDDSSLRGGSNRTTVRSKRLNLSSGQVVTVGGYVSLVNRSPTIVRHNITSEKFPIEYGVMNGSTQICDTVTSPTLNNLSKTVPIIIGGEFAYHVINSPGSVINEIVRVKNFRANPSCMSGPLSLNGTTVSMFIVYSNTNSNKNIMPHDAAWNTPILSLSSTDDFCVFIGGITGTVAGTFGTILTITQIVSGSIQQGATISTPSGGFLSSARAGTTMGNIGNYNISIPQYVPPGTRITASNGIGRVYTGVETATNGPTLGIDTMKQDFISLYTNNTAATVYRNNASVAQTIPATTNMPSSGIMTQFTGSITTTTLTVTKISSGVIEIGSIINIPGNPIKPIVTAYGASTFGFAGTYTVEPSFATAVPVGTNMTTDTKATRFTATISGTTLTVSAMSFGTIQIGATVNITGNSAKPIITGYGASTFGLAGTYTINTSLTVATGVIMTTTDPIIPDILFVKSTATGTTTRVLSPAYTSVTTAGATTTSTTPFKISSIGLGLQPSNISRINSLLPNYFFDGTICEVLLYNLDVSTNFYKNQLLEGYLAWKWGAQTKLPLWHLYRYNPPGAFVEKAIPTGSLRISKITDTSFTVSWPNNNITGNYSYFLIESPAASPQTFTGANATDNGIEPKLNISWNKSLVTDNWATSKSVTISGLRVNTAYKFRIMSHGSLSFVNTDGPDIIIGRITRTLIGNGSSSVTVNGPAKATGIAQPRGVAVDANGNLYITSFAGSAAYTLTAANERVTRIIIGTGLTNPSGVAVDASGDVYIADSINNCIRKFTKTTGITSTIAGTGTAGFNNDGINATTAQLNNPSGVAVDASGNVYIADSLNHRIRKITITTGIISTIAGTGTAGFTGNNMTATQSALNNPRGVAVHANGDVYVADTSNHCVRFINVSQGGTPTLRMVAGSQTQISGFEGEGVSAGWTIGVKLASPNGVAVDASGNVYVADTDNHRIRKITVVGGNFLISTIAGTGTAGFTGNELIATQSALRIPYGVAVDAKGDVYVADTGNHYVRKITYKS